jgi:hypothetical protein
MGRITLVGPIVADARPLLRVEFELCRVTPVQSLRAFRLFDLALATAWFKLNLIVADVARAVAGVAGDA